MIHDSKNGSVLLVCWYPTATCCRPCFFWPFDLEWLFFLVPFWDQSRFIGVRIHRDRPVGRSRHHPPTGDLLDPTPWECQNGPKKSWCRIGCKSYNLRLWYLWWILYSNLDDIVDVKGFLVGTSSWDVPPSGASSASLAGCFILAQLLSFRGRKISLTSSGKHLSFAGNQSIFRYFI